MLCGAFHKDILPCVSFSFEQSNMLYSVLFFPLLSCQSKGQQNRARAPWWKQSPPEAKHIAKMHTEACDISGHPVKEVARGPGLAPPSEEKGRWLMWEHDCTNPHRLQVFSFPQSQEIMVGASGPFCSEMCLLCCCFVEVLGHPPFEVSHFLTLISHSPYFAESTLTVHHLKSRSDLLQNYKCWSC